MKYMPKCQFSYDIQFVIMTELLFLQSFSLVGLTTFANILKVIVMKSSAMLKKLVFCFAFMVFSFASISAQSRSNTFYFEGNIGPYPVHMTLTFHGNNTVNGYYSYDSQVEKGHYDTLPLKGTYSGDIDDAQLVLMEYSVRGDKVIGTFNCRIEGGYGWDGNISSHYLTISGGSGYRNYKSGKVYRVELFASNFYRR